MISEDSLVAQPFQSNETNQYVHHTDDAAPAPHCKWCASQGMTKHDDDLFDMHFKTIVDAMRKHEGKISREAPASPRISKSSMRDLDVQSEEGTQISSSLNYASWARWGAAQSILSCLVLGVICIYFAGQSSSININKLSKETFSTTTGSLKMNVTDGNAVWSRVGTQSSMPILYWRGGWQDELALVTGKYNHCTWIKASGDQLESPDGLILYSHRAPEMDIAANMRTLRDRAFKYYQAFGHYPEQTSDLADGASYINTVTALRQNFEIKQVVNGAIVSGGGNVNSDSRVGAMAGKTDNRKPGVVWGIGVKSNPIIAADNNCYAWKNNSFYIYGSDRAGKPLAGGAPGKDFVIALNNGQDETEIQKAFLAKDSDKVAVYSGVKPDAGSIRWRYSFLCLSVLMLVMTVIFRAVHGRLNDNQWIRYRRQEA